MSKFINAEIPKGYIKRVTSTIPFGYMSSDISGWLEPIPSQLEDLEFICDMVVAESLSLRMAAEWLHHKTGRYLSHIGLKKHIDKTYDRTEERLGTTP
jgi:hypothetical protein